MNKKGPPLFKRIELKHGMKEIGTLQNEFEKFWNKVVSPLVDKSPEKTQGMRKMQEACMWLTRALAIQSYDSQQEKTHQNCIPMQDLKETKQKVTVIHRNSKLKKPE